MGGREPDTCGSGYGQVAGYREHRFAPMFQMRTMSWPAEDQRDSQRLCSIAPDQSQMPSIFCPCTVLARGNRRYTSGSMLRSTYYNVLVRTLSSHWLIPWPWLLSLYCIPSPETTLTEVLQPNICPWLTIHRILYTCRTDISCRAR